MGAGLGLAALRVARGLDHAPARLYVGMALTALDDDPAPVYYRGQEAMAEILGTDPHDAGLRAVRRALRSLTSTGFVRSSPSAPGRYARHWLLDGGGNALSPNSGRSPSCEQPPTADGQRPVNNEGMADAQRPNGGRSASLTADGQRPPEEKEEKEEPAAHAHPHEDNARRSLERIHRDRRLPLTVDELLAEAYRIGDGDPWHGYQSINAATQTTLTGARNPAAVLRNRLHAITP